MTWEIAALCLGTLVVGMLVGIALGYTRGQIDGRMEMWLELNKYEEGEDDDEEGEG